MTTQQCLSQVTPMQSLSAIRNLVRCGISHVAHARCLCDVKNAFVQQTVFGAEVPCLIANNDTDRQLVAFLESGAFDALNKGYLHELSLCIYNSGATCVEESFTFSFEYSPDVKFASVSFVAEIPTSNESKGNNAPNTALCNTHLVRNKESSTILSNPSEGPLTVLVNMLHTLSVIIKRFPPRERRQKMKMSFRLRYNARTPPDYQPNGFQDPNEQLSHIYYMEERCRVPVMISASTAHHSIGFSVTNAAFARSKRHRETTVEDRTTPVDEESEEAEGIQSTRWNATDSSSISASAAESLISDIPTDLMTVPSNPSTFSIGAAVDAARPQRKRAANVTSDSYPQKDVPHCFPQTLSLSSPPMSPHKVQPNGSRETYSNIHHATSPTARRSYSPLSNEWGDSAVPPRGGGSAESTKPAGESGPRGSLSLVQLPPIAELAERESTYRFREVAFLFFCVYLYRLSTSVSTGRRITTADVQHFLQYDCPWEATEEWVVEAVNRLLAEGYLKEKSSSSSSSSLLMDFGSFSAERCSAPYNAPFTTTHQWEFSGVRFQPLYAKLMRHEELRELFTPPPSGDDTGAVVGAVETTRQTRQKRIRCPQKRRNVNTARDPPLLGVSQG